MAVYNFQGDMIAERLFTWRSKELSLLASMWVVSETIEIV